MNYKFGRVLKASTAGWFKETRFPADRAKRRKIKDE
jgi:hypothetical protein